MWKGKATDSEKKAEEQNFEYPSQVEIWILYVSEMSKLIIETNN